LGGAVGLGAQRRRLGTAAWRLAHGLEAQERTQLEPREPCVGIRKTGPVSAEGARWLLYATRCVPSGQSITEADIEGFVREARLRE